MKRRILDLLRRVWMIGPLEKALVELTIGKTFGVPVTRLPPNHYQYRKGTIRRVERDGIRYELDLHDMVDWYIYFGFREPARQRVYKAVNTGDVVIDVGANVGDTSLHFAKLVGARGKVHAFEPHPVTFQRFKKNAELNELPNLVLNPVGLGSANATFTMRSVDEGNQGMNQISRSAPGSGDLEIIVTTLDEYADRNAMDRMDLIKIDVEGFEYDALLGSRRSLERWHPVLFIELDEHNLMTQGSDPVKLVRFLEELGYQLEHAETGEAVTSLTDLRGCHFDLLARVR
jgi:FkbM family methyltransferase